MEAQEKGGVKKMKRGLIREKKECWYFVGGDKIDGFPSGVEGDLTGVRGDIDECELTDVERSRGIKIDDLIEIDKNQKAG